MGSFRADIPEMQEIPSNEADLERLRSATSRLLMHAQFASTADLAAAVDKAAAAYRLVLDAGKLPAEQRKLAFEELKLQREHETAPAREASDRRKDYVTVFAPLLTLLTLSATLVFQSWQFRQTEIDKGIEAQRGDDRAVGAKWDATLKTISETTKQSPIIVLLQPFLGDPRTATQARTEVVELAANGTDPILFDQLLGILSAFSIQNVVSSDPAQNAFTARSVQNATEDLLAVDRRLYSRGTPLFSKSWNEITNTNDPKKLTASERPIYSYVDGAILKLSPVIAAVLRSPHPPSTVKDLSGALLHGADLSGADLHDIILRSANLAGIDLKDADLGGVTDFSGLLLSQTAWWEARRVSPALLAYLQKSYPCQENVIYGPDGNKRFTQAQCAAHLNRLSRE